ncbi:hypothetical protein [Burkholderia cenocepacia]|uniref:hypothetical protein n=1 Tax=Burkholderia cenocepacia TaxID=95486 RepID=UPI001F49D47D|nr:hypothetical protein [Burkholderia cenocepacia]
MSLSGVARSDGGIELHRVLVASASHEYPEKQTAGARCDRHRQMQGHTFFVAENGVWLTDAVPAAYLELIDTRAE